VTPLEALVARAARLEGARVRDLAAGAGRAAPAGGVRSKGRVGELVEAVLGAEGGPGQRRIDFPSLGVELKTIPVSRAGRVLESTFVCAIRVDEDVDFEASWVRAKLARVLFVPIVGDRTTPVPERTLGKPVLWAPIERQLAQLKSDYDDIIGLIGVGRIEDVSARIGRYLQLRPKAKDGAKRALAFGADGERVPTVPRGFYLRAVFTQGLLADPGALP
jgi:DNA mismatch repair protein MutH